MQVGLPGTFTPPAISAPSDVRQLPVGEEQIDGLSSVVAPVREPSGSSSSLTDDGNGDGSAAKREAESRARQQFEAEKIQIEQAEIKQLKARDREVRAHEAAHAAVGGKYAGAPKYQFKQGPDGVRYAVSGEVSIDVSPIPGDPEGTIQKMRQVRAAATAPAEPSAQDRRVAAEASAISVDAQSKLLEARQAEREQQQEIRSDRRAEQQEESEAQVDFEQTEVEVRAVERPSVEAPQVSSSESDESDGEESAFEEDKPNAKERLEEILLSTSTSVSDQAIQSGFIGKTTIDVSTIYDGAEPDKGGYLDFLV